MSSAPRDDGGRARRRRRRGPAPMPRNDPEQISTRYQRRVHDQQPNVSPRNFSTPQPPRASPNGHIMIRPIESLPRNPNEIRYREKGSPSSSVSSPQPDVVNTQAQDDRQKAEAEKEEREKKEQEEKEKIERQQKQAELLARREAERKLNLSYYADKSGGDATKQRPSGSELRQLDSSLKKCTGFVRKLRFSGVTEETVTALCHEAESLNLSRYISEVVSAITENRLRSSDSEYLVRLCGHLHRRYEDFITELVPALAHVVLGTGSNGNTKDLSSRKAATRIVIEVFVLGMCHDTGPVMNMLRHLVRGVKDNEEESISNLSIVSSFVRSGSRALFSSKQQDSQDSSESQITGPVGADWEYEVVPQATKAAFSSTLQTYYDGELTRLIRKAAEKVRNAGIAVSRSKNARGDPDDTSASTYDDMKHSYDKVIASASIIAEALGKPSPENLLSHDVIGKSGETKAKEDVSQFQVAVTGGVPGNRNKADQVTEVHHDSPFDGSEEREFYTEFPVLHDQRNREPLEKASSDTSQPRGGERVSSGKDRTRQSGGPRSPLSPSSTGDSKHPVAVRVVDVRKRGAERPISIDKLLGRLASVESKESADSFVHSFVQSIEGNKLGPKRLAKALWTVSSQKLNLLPAYARVAASLFPSFSEVAVTVASNLEEEFRHLTGKTDMDEKHLPVCIKNAKYIGEYVKFGLMEMPTMFDLLGLCIRDFSGHRVDIACHLVETCGRFAYRTPSSHIRMANTLETLWRLKSVKNLEARHNALVETAYFTARPASTSRMLKRKARPPLHEYVRHLIYYRLGPTNIRWTQNQLLKLPWDRELEHYVTKKFVKISRARFSTIPYVSTLIANLQKYKPGLVVSIVDSLVESIRWGMEKNDGRDSQRRIAEIQLLGELHKCGVVDEKLVYNVLYQSITLGHETESNSDLWKRYIPSTAPSLLGEQGDQNVTSRRPMNNVFTQAPDPPGDFFRVRIACVLIESCGRILCASNRRKLEVFWVFFERYIFCKAYQAGLGDQLPLQISHVVGDAFEHVLQRERRGLENRIARKETELNGRGIAIYDVHGGRSATRPFTRCSTLTESLEAVQKVEQSASDAALICIPIRHVFDSSQTRQNTPTSPPTPEIPLKRQSFLGNEQTQEREAVKTATPSTNSLHDERDDDANTNGSDSSTADASLQDMDGSDILEGSESQFDEDFDEIKGLEDPEIDFEDLEDGHEQSAADEDDGDEDSDVEDSDDDDDDDDDIDDDDDDDVVLDIPLSRPKTEEEDAFEKELAAYTAAAVQSAKAQSRVTKFDRMTIPMSLMTKKLEEERAAAAAAAANLLSESSEDENGMKISRKKKRAVPESPVDFKILVRKGGKSQLQNLQVPASSSLALAAKENETADAARHEETKRLVLGSKTVLNHNDDEVDEEVPLRTQQNVREKEESIRQQRSADEMELLSTLYRNKPRGR